MGVRPFRSVEELNTADDIRKAATAAPGLRLLVLHGSRARGDARPGSDWDFAYLATPEFDADALLANLGEVVRSDAVDLADLSRASGLLRFNAASDGIAMYESESGAFEQFQLDAISTWLDMAAVLGPAYDERLERLAAAARLTANP